MFDQSTPGPDQQDDYWVSAADLLGGALIIFFLLMLYFMLTEEANQRAQTEAWAETVESLEQKLEGEKQAVDALRKKLLGAQVNVDKINFRAAIQRTVGAGHKGVRTRPQPIARAKLKR